MVRYERAEPGELLHLDVKKLGRIVKVGHRITGDRRDHRGRNIGWDYLHVAIDDASRVAYARSCPMRMPAAAVAFLRAAVAYYAGLGVPYQRGLHGQRQAYRGRTSPAPAASGTDSSVHQALYSAHQWQGGALHPKQLREWAYARAYGNPQPSPRCLPQWLHGYNWHRPHASLAGQPPLHRLGLNRNNLLRLHT